MATRSGSLSFLGAVGSFINAAIDVCFGRMIELASVIVTRQLLAHQEHTRRAVRLPTPDHIAVSASLRPLIGSPQARSTDTRIDRLRCPRLFQCVRSSNGSTCIARILVLRKASSDPILRCLTLQRFIGATERNRFPASAQAVVCPKIRDRSVRRKVLRSQHPECCTISVKALVAITTDVDENIRRVAMRSAPHPSIRGVQSPD